nr:phage holin [uncultured Mogibacterium sp.]
MKINWKVRFRNKVWLRLFIVAVLGLAYKAMATFGIVPKIEQQALMDLFDMLLGILLLLGVIVDPTTKGVGDSERAMTYGKFDYNEQLTMQTDEEEAA